MARYPLVRQALAAAPLVLTTLLASASLSAHAQTPARITSTGLKSPIEGERLSDWLLRQTPDPSAYPTGLHWQVPAERVLQDRLKRELLTALNHLSAVDVLARTRMVTMIEALPVTGRVRLAVPDARWLQAHPQEDPRLKSDHVVNLPLRPTTVSVITPSGERCTLPHQTGAQARDYLRACAGVDRTDSAWVIQPDGRVAQVAIASWNEQVQGELAPGAMLWAPPRDSAWPEAVSKLLVQFWATQAYDTLLATTESMSAPPFSATVLGATARNLPLTANDWGVIGLMQTPTARMSPAGDARFHVSRVFPYERINVFLQPFDALEVGFRYTSVVNRLYGPDELSGKQPYKDKSIDFKLRLWEESARLPQVAMGMSDIGGTGLFSSEYLVANKRWGPVDASLGMGWGYLGSRGNIKNPLSVLSSRFNTRTIDVGTGGTPSTSAFFRGPAALFGGVQYQTPFDNWVLKAEYEGNNYRNEPQANLQPQRSPINVGMVYRPSPAVDVSFGVERGNTVMFGLTLHASLARMSSPKVSDAPTPKVLTLRPMKTPEWTGTAADVVDMSGWGVTQIARDGSALRVMIAGAAGAHWDDRIERIVAVLHRDAPTTIDTFVLTFAEQGIELSEMVIDRNAWVKRKTEFLPPSSVQPVTAWQAPREGQTHAQTTLWEPTPSRFGYALVPSWQQNIGGPDGFLLFRAGLAVPMRLKLADSVSVSGAVNFNAVDNFGHFKYTAPSDMPRVRTYLREYMTTSRVNIPNLQITHFGALTSNQFYSVYAGYLESMYGGVGGEWLYRPWRSPVAFGVDVNKVQQRNFNQFFGFDAAGSQTGYRVTTGHATAYWDTGWQSTTVKLSVGQYLAGDKGATLDLGKTFTNGVAVGAWVTKTNVSALRFGEGSFDKGLYLRIPFDVMTTTRSSSTANLTYNPLTRDGGARLNRDFTLMGATTARSASETGFVPAQTGTWADTLK